MAHVEQHVPPPLLRWRAVDAVLKAASRRVVLVSAPPGWGKSSAVRMAFPNAPVVSCSAANGDAGSLVFAVASAFGISGKDAGRVIETASQGSFAPDVAGWIAQTIGPGNLCIFDDVHALESDLSSVSALRALLDYQDIRLVFAGRSLTGVPVGTLLARGDADVALGKEDLAFDESDCRALLASLSLDESSSPFLIERSEGWPLGVSLAASLLSRGYDPESAWRSTQPALEDVVVDEIVERLRGSDYEDLVEACLYASAGAPAPRRFASVPWATDRPHQIVVDGVLRRIDRERLAPLVQSGIGSLASRGMEPQAYDLAVRFGMERPDDLLERFGFALFDAGRYDALRIGLRQVPSSVREERAVLLGLDALLISLGGDFARADGLLERAVHQAEGEARFDLAARLADHRLNKWNIADAAKVLDDLPDLTERSSAAIVFLHAAKMAHMLSQGERAKADEVFAAISVAANKISAPLPRVNIEKARAFGAFAAEDWDLVEESVSAMESIALAHGMLSSQSSAYSFRFAIAHAVRADYDAARDYAMRMIDLGKKIFDHRLTTNYLSAAYEADTYAGRWESARVMERRIEKAGQGWRSAVEIAICRALVDCHEGRHRAAADRLMAIPVDPEDRARRRCKVAMAALVSASAGDHDRARSILDTLDSGSKSKRIFEHIEGEFADGVAALAELLVGRNAAAARRLRVDPVTKHGKNFIMAARLFAGSGDVSLASEALRSAGLHGFAELLPRGDTMENPLTPAEVRVLRDLARGMRPAQIAESVGRSLLTIRNQIKSAMRKLGASSAMEAVARARAAGMIESD